MHDTFVPLAEYLRAPAAASTCEAVEEAQPPGEHDAEIVAADGEGALEDALAEVRRFRAALADALDARIEVLLREIATTVVGREIGIAPADVRAIVAREIALAGEPPLKIRANPFECDALRRAGYAVAADPAMRRGDLAIELRSGTIDASLGCRLEGVLDRACVR